MLYHEVVNHRSHHIAEEDSQHHTLGVTGVLHTDDDGHGTNDEAIDELADIGAARGDGVGSHEDGTEGKATQYEVVPPYHVRCTNLLEQDSQQATAYEDAAHGAPRSNARPQQEHGTQGNGYHGSLTNRTGDEAENHIADASIGIDTLGNLSQRSSGRKRVGQRVTQSEDAVLRNPNGVTCHLRRIGEEQEHTGSDGGIEEVHTRTTENLLTEDYAEGTSQRQHTQRTADGYNQRNQDTRYQITFLNLLVLPLCPGKLNAQADHVTDDDLRQHGQETIEEHLPEGSC